MTGAKARHLLDEGERSLGRLERELARVRCGQYLSRQADPDAARIDAALADLLDDDALADAVACLAEDAGDPLEARRAVLWRRRLDDQAIDGDLEVRALRRSVEERVTAFVPGLAGARGMAAVRHVLRTDPDRSRRRLAHEALAPLSLAVAGDLRRLMALREARAHRRTRQGYVAAVLERMELTPGRVAAFFQALLHDSQGAYQAALAECAARAGIDGDLRPWDVEFLLGTSTAPESVAGRFAAADIVPALSAFVRDHGLEPLTLGVSFVACDIPYNGLCVPVDPPHDIRILASPRDGIGYYHTLTHELGHAMHSRFQEAPTRLWRDEPGVFKEAMGETLAAFVEDAAWLSGRGLDVRQIDAVHEDMRRGRLAFVRLRTVRALCEYALYADPAADGDEVLARVEAEVLGVREDDTPRWAADAWYVSYPVYWQNYVLAACVASQSADALRRAWGGLYGVPQALDTLRQGYWRPAAAIAWPDKVAAVTGAPLSTAALVADLGGDWSEGHMV